jgi:hypothetical protein
LAALFSMRGEASAPGGETPASGSGFATHEMAAAFGFAAIPIITLVIAKLFTGVLGDRYVIPTVIGFSILIAVAPATLKAGRSLVSLTLLLALLVACWGDFMAVRLVTFQRWVKMRPLAAQEPQRKGVSEFLLSDSEHDLPIAVSDPHTFMWLSYYAAPEVARRLVYLADPERSLRHVGEGSADHHLLRLKPWFPVHVEMYGPYVASHPRFLVYGNTLLRLNWLLPELMASGARIELRGQHGTALLFLADSKQQLE